MSEFWYRMLAAFTMFLSAIVGLFFNVLVILALKRNGSLSSIFKICLVKSFSNVIICGGFLIWPVPCALSNRYFLPEYFNVFMGQIVGWFAVTLGPLTQVLLAGNRFMAVYFPRVYGTMYAVNPTSVGLGVSFIIASLAGIAGFFKGCHFIFVVETLGWMSEDSPCAELLSNIFTVIVLSLACVSNSFNIATFIKLVIDSKKVNLSNNEISTRQTKNRRMLAQSVLHDMLILIDMCNSCFVFEMYDKGWFQFLTTSFSMVFIRMLEGLTMLLINERIKEGARFILGLKTKSFNIVSSHQSEPNPIFVKSTPRKHKELN